MDGFRLFGESIEPLGAVLVPVAFATQLIVLALAFFGTSNALAVHDGVFLVYPGTSTAPFYFTRDASIAVIFLGDAVGLSVCLCAFARTAFGQSDERGLFWLAARRYGPLLWIMAIEGVLVAVASVAFLVPGIYLAVAFAVALPVLVVEDVRGSKALTRSRQLVQGRWWSTFVATACAPVFLIGGVFGIRGLLRAATTVPAYALLRAGAEFALEVLILPIGAAIAIAVYADLRAREGQRTVLMGSGAVAIPPSPSPSRSSSPAPRDRWAIRGLTRRQSGAVTLALALATVGAAVALLVRELPAGGPDLAAAEAALERFRPPSGFVSVALLDGREPCGDDARCFRVSRPSAAFRPPLRKILKSVGATDVTGGSCSTEGLENTYEVQFCQAVGVLDGTRAILVLQPLRDCPSCVPTRGSSEVILSVFVPSYPLG